MAKMYNIRGVPANLLISPEGKILARNLRGENLSGETISHSYQITWNPVSVTGPYAKACGLSSSNDSLFF